MTIETDDEILQDFLIEAGELIEQLGEQLVDLEQSPEDSDLLNAVFRSFHTVKGGAGFLAINNLVEICHRAEDVFNLLRQGDRQVDAYLMDVVLRVLDVVNDMFEMVRNGEEPPPADPALLEQLVDLAKPEQATAATAAEKPVATTTSKPSTKPTKGKLDKGKPSKGKSSATKPVTGAPEGDISDDDFEQLLDAAAVNQSADKKAVSTPSAADGDISDDEFEALLDQLHGKGKFSGATAVAAEPASEEPPVDPGADEISDEEFEALLDEIHGKGKFKVAATAQVEPAAAEESVAPKIAVPAKKEPPKRVQPQSGETTVRVDTQRLDDIMNLVGELVLVRNRLGRLKATIDDDEVAKAVANLDIVTADLQLSVMKTRMQPIKKVFGRFPRVVRDLARNMDKEIKLEMRGEETDLDKNLVEALADPLVHLVRNSVDHGIENPDKRQQSGKPPAGTIVLSAEQEGDHILLAIEDDGAGMDAEVLRQKAVEKGMMDQSAADRLTPKECFNLIFAAGFSTKKEISDVSGRGVGMDVVKTRISQLNGSVAIDAELGKGTRIAIQVPLTLAIMPTLMVVLGDQTFALPLANVNEIFDLDLARTNVVDGQLTVMVRDRAMPLFYLREWLIKDAPPPDSDLPGHVVVVNAGARQVGFVVDQLIGQEEVVIKPLGALLHGMDGLAGATITGDGRIALILDVPGLLKAYVRKF